GERALLPGMGQGGAAPGPVAQHDDRHLPEARRQHQPATQRDVTAREARVADVELHGLAAHSGEVDRALAAGAERDAEAGDRAVGEAIHAGMAGGRCRRCGGSGGLRGPSGTDRQHECQCEDDSFQRSQGSLRGACATYRCPPAGWADRLPARTVGSDGADSCCARGTPPPSCHEQLAVAPVRHSQPKGELYGAWKPIASIWWICPPQILYTCMAGRSKGSKFIVCEVRSGSFRIGNSFCFMLCRKCEKPTARPSFSSAICTRTLSIVSMYWKVCELIWLAQSCMPRSDGGRGACPGTPTPASGPPLGAVRMPFSSRSQSGANGASEPLFQSSAG